MNAPRWNGSLLCSLILLTIAPCHGVLIAQTATGRGLPPDAVVIERAGIPSRIHRNRELVLWMLAPRRHDRGDALNDAYTCPEQTLGSYYSGPTRISLVDTGTKVVINTIDLRHEGRKDDSFDIPYRILADFYYKVPGHENGSEGKPALLTLHDFNGDGLPLEAAFFEAQACMGLETTLIGYSPRRDQVIHYDVELTVINGPKIQTSSWADYLFAEPPVQPGHWAFTIDYSGRGGCVDKHDVRYDRARERFVGTLVSSNCEFPDAR